MSIVLQFRTSERNRFQPINQGRPGNLVGVQPSSLVKGLLHMIAGYN